MRHLQVIDRTTGHIVESYPEGDWLFDTAVRHAADMQHLSYSEVLAALEHGRELETPSYRRRLVEG